MKNNTENVEKLLEKTLVKIPVPQELRKMIEPLDPRKIGVTHNYSVTFAHVNMVKELAEALSKAEGAFVSEGEIIRRAVDALYADTFPIVEGK